MIRKVVDGAGDRCLDALTRVRTRRGFLAAAIGAGAATVGLAESAKAVQTFYCVSSNGCIVRDAPWGNYILTYSAHSHTDYAGGAYDWSTPYTGCIGTVDGDTEYFWRKRDGYGRYVHANLLSPVNYTAC